MVNFFTSWLVYQLYKLFFFNIFFPPSFSYYVLHEPHRKKSDLTQTWRYTEKTAIKVQVHSTVCFPICLGLRANAGCMSDRSNKNITVHASWSIQLSASGCLVKISLLLFWTGTICFTAAIFPLIHEKPGEMSHLQKAISQFWSWIFPSGFLSQFLKGW